MEIVMRQRYLESLRNFSETLNTFKINAPTWVQQFLDYQRSDSTTLLSYNVFVLSWLKKWTDGFITQLMHTSVFEIEQADVDIERTIRTQRAQLAVFFVFRASLLPFGMSDITRMPYMPAHVACLQASEIVKQASESVCQFILPYVKRVIGSAIPTDVKAATEDSDGKFEPWHFVGVNETDTLISVMDYLNYVRDHPETRAHFFQTEDYRAALESFFDRPARSYIKILEYFYVQLVKDKQKFGVYYS